MENKTNDREEALFDVYRVFEHWWFGIFTEDMMDSVEKNGLQKTIDNHPDWYVLNNGFRQDAFKLVLEVRNWIVAQDEYIQSIH